MNKEHIYLDNNATTALLPEVKEFMFDIYGTPLNASAIHAVGANAKSHMERARKVILSILNANNHQLVFAGSGTEVNNLLMHNI